MSQGACFPCLAGQFKASQDDVDAACQRCPMGQYQPNLSGKSCINCEVGRVQQSRGALECVVCLPGTFQARAGQAACDTIDECPAGKERGASTPSSQGRCVSCPMGQAKANNGKWDAACFDCAPGRYSKGAAAECTLCAAGTFQDALSRARARLALLGDLQPSRAARLLAIASFAPRVSSAR